ncbi:hypothetical protein [Apilactobacillus kunkeei]|uniref:hypothetical protein n=1 Tax=Apilactobacillus kunkeei TaxID=148814 RepID=UPI0006CE9022|nr:hypothetical protein [Apilactobacillus kunkeei]
MKINDYIQAAKMIDIPIVFAAFLILPKLKDVDNSFFVQEETISSMKILRIALHNKHLARKS